MEFLGLGRKYKFAVGEKVQYIGDQEKAKKAIDGKILTVKSRSFRDGVNACHCAIGGAERASIHISEDVLKKYKSSSKRKSGSTTKRRGRSSRNEMTKQDIERMARERSIASGVREYNQSLAESREEVMAEMRG